MSLRTRLRLLAVLAGAALVWTSASAADFPSKPIEIVVPLTPGSAPDILARLIGQPLSERLGQPVVVNSRPGAGGQLGMNYLKRAAPDGHTLLLIHSGIVAAPFMYKTANFDLIKDFTHVIALSSTPYVLAASKQITARTVPELVAYAKANPGKVNFGNTGGDALEGIRLMRLAGFQSQMVTYNGGAPVLTALAADEIQLAVFSARGVKTVEDRGVRGFAVAAKQRFSLAPQIPTFDELGLKGFYGGYWYGLMGPAGMPPEVLARLNNEINQILKMPEVRKRILEGMTNEPIGGTPAEFESMTKELLDQYRQAAAAAGVVPQ